MNAASVLEASYNVTPEDVLAGIHVFRVHDVSDLTTVLSGSLPEIVHHYHTTAQPVKLVVIDSIAFPFRAADPGSDFIARTRHLTATAAALSELASTYQIAVVAINQMTTKFMSTMNSTGNELNTNNSSMKLVPALGESWAHAVTTRLVLSANEGNQQRICTLTKSPRLPTGSAAFQIVEAGVRGVEYTHSSKRQRTEDPQ